MKIFAHRHTVCKCQMLIAQNMRYDMQFLSFFSSTVVVKQAVA